MYQDLKPLFWWTKMKKKIAAFVARCDNCCRVKAVHMKQAYFNPYQFLDGNGKKSAWISC